MSLLNLGLESYQIIYIHTCFVFQVAGKIVKTTVMTEIGITESRLRIHFDISLARFNFIIDGKEHFMGFSQLVIN